MTNKKVHSNKKEFSPNDPTQKEKEIIREMRKPSFKHNVFYGFHSWEGKAQGKNVPNYSDILVDQSTFSLALVKKLTDRGISVIYLGQSAKHHEIVSYALSNKGILLITNSKELDGQILNGKSMLLGFQGNLEERSITIAAFAKEIPEIKIQAEPKIKTEIPIVQTQKEQVLVVAPTWQGDTPYAEVDIKSSNIVVNSDRPGPGPKLVDKESVEQFVIAPPSILKLTSGKVELSKKEMEGIWNSKTVIASINNARNYLKNPQGIVLSIGAGPTDPIARSLAEVQGVYTVSLDRSVNYLHFLKEKIGGEEKRHGYVVADARYLPFREGSVQSATSTYLFDKLDGKELALSLLEARRVSNRNLYLEIAPSQGDKKFESVKFLMELCGFSDSKSLNHRVSFKNGNSARSYIFTAESKGISFKAELIREAASSKGSPISKEAKLMETMLTTDYGKYRNMNRFFETVAENLYALLEQNRKLGGEGAMERFVYNLIISARERGSFSVRFNPLAKSGSEEIDTERLKRLLDSHYIKYTMANAKKGAIDLKITEVPHSTIRILELLRTEPAKLHEATKRFALESIYKGVDTEEMMHRLDTQGYWGEETGPKVIEDEFVLGVKKVTEHDNLAEF